MIITVPALTVKQPWASAIVAGVKPVENRTWVPPAWIMDRMILIHAAVKPDLNTHIQDIWPDSPNTLINGVVVGVARVVGCVSVIDRPCCPWSYGPYCWLLKDAIEVDPFPLRGMLKIFRVPMGVLPASVADLMELTVSGGAQC